MTTVEYASALMGSGKTQEFISSLDGERNILFAAPTKKLGIDVNKRIGDTYQDHYHDSEVINSDDKTNIPVRERIEKALTEGREGSVVIITHNALLNIDPQYLEGWEIVVDEVPEINLNEYKRVGANTYNTLFADLLDDGMEELVGICGIQPHLKIKANDLYADAWRTENKAYTLILGGLLSDTAVVTKEISKTDGGVTFLVHNYANYEPIIRNAKEFHILGNAIEQSLFHLFVEAKGINIKESKYTPDFSGYKMPPTLVPMVEGNKFSKEMMMLRDDGVKGEEFDNKCWGFKIIDKALSYHADEKVLVQCFDWMKHKELIDKYPNAEFTKFDLRGVNSYSHFSRTVNIIHGNPEPIRGRMDAKLLDILGIDKEKGERAIRYFRYIENIS
ncbi:MAG: hypothetical protein U5L98_06880 [Halomonas sp.]|uniref:hypothetical protein n=1 Tax=Halomonas sp. TaxID=1486246 RepID=UPI002ACE0D4B|nr:hypothetical protein [Halomonas sp.]MDZ7852366.1 hypothetical protein [Halomonas sp.]